MMNRPARNLINPSDLRDLHMQSEPPPWLASGDLQPTRAQQAGLRYELAVHRALLRDFTTYLPAPWISYTLHGRRIWCQPDGLLFNPNDGIITIVEIKLHHTDDAFDQLINRYLPLVQAFFPPRLWRYRICEVCRWYDPHTRTAATPHMVQTLRDCRTDAFNVMPFSP